MSNTPIRLAVIIGSTREGRFAPVVANWFAEQAGRRTDTEVDLIDLAEADLPPVLGTPAPGLAEVTDRLAAAEAFVVVTPEYNHSYPASLKHAIDLHHAQWQVKPVGFVSYGGISGGLRAVEHLRQVFAELHTVTVRETVSFHGAWERFDADGRPVKSDQVNAAATTLLDQLGWWALALRDARAVRPYSA